MSTIVGIVLLLGLVGLFALTRTGGSAADLPGFLERGAPILDVRTPGEFAGGHVRGAMNIPVEQLAKRLTEVPEGPVVVYCRSGMRNTGNAPRSLRPSMTSSLASTVPSFGHQLTVCSPR